MRMHVCACVCAYVSVRRCQCIDVCVCVSVCVTECVCVCVRARARARSLVRSVARAVCRHGVSVCVRAHTRVTMSMFWNHCGTAALMHTDECITKPMRPFAFSVLFLFRMYLE